MPNVLRSAIDDVREYGPRLRLCPDPRDFKSEEAALTSLFEIQFEAIAKEVR